MKRKYWVASAVCVIALAAACSKQSTSPTAPTTAAVASSNATGDGTTLKVSAPTPVSPINGVKITQGDNVVLTINNSSATYAGNIPLRYEFAVINGGGEQVFVGQNAAGATQTSVQVTATLDAETQYQWHARAFYGDHVGPWSAFAAFVSPANEGYIRGNELYDPLINGKTIGVVHGSVQFIPGVGAKLPDWYSYISYELPQTLLEGEYSVLVTNMPANTKGDKQKVMAMGQGYDDITTNDRRMTIEKRGDPPGIVAWRFITHHDQVDTEGAERTFVNFLANQVYFFRVTWRDNLFKVKIQEGGAAGPVVYEFGKHWDGDPYDPKPHVIYVGSPIGRSGPSAASIENTIYRQVWVSGNPRPNFANQ
ncbi:MAG TPA: hypothetical protein VH951_11520 [Dehalococcoidia bacterium]|jgi:hypothetical protein